MFFKMYIVNMFVNSPKNNIKLKLLFLKYNNNHNKKNNITKNILFENKTA